VRVPGSTTASGGSIDGRLVSPCHSRTQVFVLPSPYSPVRPDSQVQSSKQDPPSGTSNVGFLHSQTRVVLVSSSHRRTKGCTAAPPAIHFPGKCRWCFGTGTCSGCPGSNTALVRSCRSQSCTPPGKVRPACRPSVRKWCTGSPSFSGGSRKLLQGMRTVHTAELRCATVCRWLNLL